MPSFRLSICALVLASTAVFAQDKIVLQNDQVQQGQITGSDADGVNITLAIGAVKVPMTQIKSVEMAAPSALEEAKKADAARQVTLLEPLLAKYKALPADWVLDAMGILADAYAVQGQDDKSGAIYDQIRKLYPGSKYLIKANVGTAKTAIRKGNADEAIQLLKPLITEANAQIAPPPDKSALYGEAFLVLGQAQELKGDASAALESYLTVVTSFYANPDLVKTAQEKAAKLRDSKPNLMVN